MLLHSERAPHSEPVRLLFIGVTALLLFLLFWSVTHEQRASIALGVALLVLLWATSSYLTTRFDVTDEAVRAVMWPFSTTVRYEELKRVGVTERPLPVALGYGVRIWGRTIFYRTRGRRGVVLEKKKKHVRFLTRLVLTTQDPEAFAKLVNDRRKAWNRLRRAEKA